jgi:hypothetical protein
MSEENTTTHNIQLKSPQIVLFTLLVLIVGTNIPASTWGENFSFYSIAILSFCCSIIPFLATSAFTSVPSAKATEENTVKATTWFALALFFGAAQLSVSFYVFTFAATELNLMTNALNSLINMPGIDQFSAKVERFLPIAKNVSGILAIISIGLIFFVTQNAKRKGQNFGGFSIVLILVLLL